MYMSLSDLLNCLQCEKTCALSMPFRRVFFFSLIIPSWFPIVLHRFVPHAIPHGSILRAVFDKHFGFRPNPKAPAPPGPPFIFPLRSRIKTPLVIIPHPFGHTRFSSSPPLTFFFFFFPPSHPPHHLVTQDTWLYD